MIDMQPTNQASRPAGKGGGSRKRWEHRWERAGAGHATNHTWRESSTQMIDKLSDPWEEQGGKIPGSQSEETSPQQRLGTGGAG